MLKISFFGYITERVLWKQNPANFFGVIYFNQGSIDRFEETYIEVTLRRQVKPIRYRLYRMGK